MTEILVVPHGGRWAVKESRDATPLAEYETCELAELAAKQLAEERGGAEVVVEREGAGRFERPPNAHPEEHESDLAGQGPDAIDLRTGDTRGTEEARLPQAGM
jgi:hypothetical protein